MSRVGSFDPKHNLNGVASRARGKLEPFSRCNHIAFGLIHLSTTSFYVINTVKPGMTTQVVSPFANNAAGESSFLPSAAGPSSSSLKSSTTLPLLRKFDIRKDSSTTRQQKKSLLTLKLSTASFLGSTIHDGLSRDPLYTIETLDTSTTVSRCDAWDGLKRTADLRWPKTSLSALAKGKGKEMKQETLIQMDGRRWISADNLLKYSAISGYVFSLQCAPEHLLTSY